MSIVVSGNLRNIQPTPTSNTETVNTGLYRLLQPLDELIVAILGQAYVRYSSVALGTCPSLLLLTRLLTIMRRIAMNSGLLLSMKSEC